MPALKGASAGKLSDGTWVIRNSGTRMVYVSTAPENSARGKRLVAKRSGFPVLPGTEILLQMGDKKPILRRK